MTESVQTTSRRKFIAGSSGFLALSSISGYLNASQLQIIKSQFSKVDKQAGIVIYKEDNASSVKFASAFASDEVNLIALGNDPVRQWRDGLSVTLANTDQPVMGMTNWSDYLMMRGLAAELRRYPAVEAEQLSGTSLFSWVIA